MTVGKKIVLLSKKDNAFCDYAEFLLNSYFSANDVLSIRGKNGSGLDKDEILCAGPQYLNFFPLTVDRAEGIAGCRPESGDQFPSRQPGISRYRML